MTLHWNKIVLIIELCMWKCLKFEHTHTHTHMAKFKNENQNSFWRACACVAISHLIQVTLMKVFLQFKLSSIWTSAKFAFSTARTKWNSIRHLCVCAVQWSHTNFNWPLNVNLLFLIKPNWTTNNRHDEKKSDEIWVWVLPDYGSQKSCLIGALKCGNIQMGDHLFSFLCFTEIGPPLCDFGQHSFHWAETEQMNSMRSGE